MRLLCKDIRYLHISYYQYFSAIRCTEQDVKLDPVCTQDVRLQSTISIWWDIMLHSVKQFSRTLLSGYDVLSSIRQPQTTFLDQYFLNHRDRKTWWLKLGKFWNALIKNYLSVSLEWSAVAGIASHCKFFERKDTSVLLSVKIIRMERILVSTI